MYFFHFSNKFAFTLLVVILFVSGCKITQSNGQDLDQVKKVAIELLGNDIDSFPNSTGAYILYVQKANSSTPTRVSKFIIIEVSTKKIITEHNFIPGYVKWSTEYTLELLSVPGMIKETESISDYIKTIDVRSIKP